LSPFRNAWYEKSPAFTPLVVHIVDRMLQRWKKKIWKKKTIKR